MAKRLEPMYPGEYLKELLAESSLSQCGLAHRLGYRRRASTTSYTASAQGPAELALRLGQYFGPAPALLAQSAEAVRCGGGKGDPGTRVAREV